MVIDILRLSKTLRKEEFCVFKKLESWRLFYYMIGIVIPGLDTDDYPIKYLPSVVTNQPCKKTTTVISCR